MFSLNHVRLREGGAEILEGQGEVGQGGVDEQLQRPHRRVAQRRNHAGGHDVIALRGGEQQEIAAEDVVPGDIVSVSSGDRVPADLRLLEAKRLRIQEAPLTGESEAVDKGTDPVPEDRRLGYEDYWRGADEHHGAGGEWRVERQRLHWDVLDRVREAHDDGWNVKEGAWLGKPRPRRACRPR